MCVGSADGYRGIAAGVTFDATYPPLYLNRTSTLAAGGTETQFYAAFPGVDAAYTVANWPGRQRAALYLVGSLAEDGHTFTIGNPALSYDPTPPCIPLGIFHATTTNSFYFCPGPLIRDDVSAATAAVSELLAAEVESLPVEATLEMHRLVLADLWARVDALDVSADYDRMLDQIMSSITERLTAVESRLESATNALSERLAVMQSDISAQSTRIDILGASDPISIQPVSQELRPAESDPTAAE